MKITSHSCGSHKVFVFVRFIESPNTSKCERERKADIYIKGVGVMADGKLRNMASIYIEKADKMLLLYRQGGSVVNDVWVGSAGGHFEEHELNNARACVLREMKEEIGITEKELENIRLRYVTLRRAKGEIRQNYYFFAKLKDGVDEEFISNEGVIKWIPFEKVTALPMPFTSEFVLKHYFDVGNRTEMLYGGIADGSKVVFTELPEF